MARLAVRLLGPLQVTLAGEPVTGFESDKVRALLAYLAVERDRPQRRERLAGLLWPERPERAARTNLRVALANLRSVIGDRQTEPPFLCISRQTIQLNPEGETWVDVAAFAALAEARDIVSLAQAVELYADAFLEGFSLSDSAAFEEWVLLTRERLAQQMLRALRHLAGCHESLGDYERALCYARRHVALDPWGERARRRLMRLLVQSGQRNAALTQYHGLQQTLAQDLGVEPEDETVALYQRIRDGATRARPSPEPQHNLPSPLTPFVGRRTELEAIGASLRDPDCRLLTLVGPGGSGKTRLALESARRLLREQNPFTDGLYFVDLAPLQSCADLVAAIAQVLNIPLIGEQSPERRVSDYLRHKRLLLLLDNFEHLLSPTAPEDECLDWLVVLLHAAPGVRVLATSRIRLNLQAEHLLPVGSMTLPETEVEPEELLSYDALALFVDGARRVQPDFQLTADNAADVIRTCRAVEGLPLAILLAAAWANRLSPAQIARRLAGEGDKGVDLLAAGWRDVPARQRSMRSVFDHSWRLLTGSERVTLQSLAVFRGGFRRQAAVEVTGASTGDLESLVHKSLLSRAPAGRYGLHELLRQYLAGRLAEDRPAREAVCGRHSAHFARALDRWADELKGEGQETALAEMEAELQNAQAAWAWLVEQGQVELLADALEGLCLFFEWRVRYRQGVAACRQAAERLRSAASEAVAADAAPTGDGLRLLARLLAWQSLFVHYLVGSEQAGPLLKKSLTVLDDSRLAGLDTRAERAHACWCQGRLSLSRDREAARVAYEQCLALYQSLGDRWGQANALAALGGVAWNLGDYREARRRHEASLSLRQEVGDKRGVANSLMAVGVTALYQGEMDAAQQLVQQGCALRQALGDRRGHADGLRHLGVTHLLSGEFARAASLLESSLAIYDDLGLQFGLEVAMLGDALLHGGDVEGARAQGAKALAIASKTGYRRAIGYARLVLGDAALALGAHAEAEGHLRESLAVYRQIDQWDEGCRALAALALAARGQGRQPWLPPGLLDDVRRAAQGGAFMPLLLGLPALALHLADGGQIEQAVALYAAAMRFAVVARSRWFEAVVGRPLAAFAADLPPELAAQAERRGRGQDPAAAVLAALESLAA